MENLWARLLKQQLLKNWYWIALLVLLGFGFGFIVGLEIGEAECRLVVDELLNKGTYIPAPPL